MDLIITRVRELIAERSPVALGTLPVSKESCGLFYKQGVRTDYLNLSDANLEQLGLLTNACQVATFGRRGEDVLDETYRKAFKLDEQDFATKLGLEVAKIIEIVRPLLFKENDDVRAELYKLNVYDKDAFFKSHQDTPRSQSHFGSLVIVFPTAHTGGALQFRHGTREWTLDSGADLTSLPSPAVSYAVFFSDVEHEVLPITSGHRVTITYNLYRGFPQSIPKAAFSNEREEERLVALFQELLDMPSLLIEGGMLAFGLQHQYPVSRDSRVNQLALELLKGTDATLLRAWRKLGYQVSLKVVVRSEESADPNSWQGGYEDESKNIYLTDKVPNIDPDYEIEDLHEQIWDDKDVLHLKGYVYDMKLRKYRKVGLLNKHFVWITPFNTKSQRQNPFLHYGNEASVAYFYTDLCLVVNVGKPQSRKTSVPVDLRAVSCDTEVGDETNKEDE